MLYRVAFLAEHTDIRFGGSSNFFSTEEMQLIGKELDKEGKVICIFFDQFEELLYKEELVEVFNEMRRICSSVEEAQLNIIIGFSWKTDGALPSEHNAYHMWHSLADRRYEIELPPFTEREVSIAINRFSRELGQPVIPQLRRLLHDHCQGFPWLLKKLCVHILESFRNGIEQIDTLNRSINIQALFKKDLENLSSIEVGCLRQIAKDSPAEFFKISQNYGDEIISRLINRRLIIRSGTKLTLYWDIFRDYILTERIPYIPVSYIPQSDFARYAKVLKHLEGLNEVAYAELASSMSLSLGAIDNIVRDMANVGHVETNRKEARVSPNFKDEKHAIEIAYNFWKSHEIVRKLQSTKTDESQISYLEFVEAFKATNKRTDLTEQTIQTYAHRVIRWLKGIGLLVDHENAYQLSSSPISKIQSFDGVKPRAKGNGHVFYAAGPFKAVTAALADKLENDISKAELLRKYGVNSLGTLNKLGFFDSEGNIVSPIRLDEIEMAVASRAMLHESVTITLEILRLEPKAMGAQIGEIVSQRLGLGWTPPTQKRNGNALKSWARHCSAVLGDVALASSTKADNYLGSLF